MLRPKLLPLLILVLSVCLADAVLTALFAAQVWWSFLSLQYGDGPSIGAWFGICLLVSAVLTSEGVPSVLSDDPLAAGRIMERALSRWVVGAITLLLAMFAGSLSGWAR